MSTFYFIYLLLIKIYNWEYLTEWFIVLFQIFGRKVVYGKGFWIRKFQDLTQKMCRLFWLSVPSSVKSNLLILGRLLYYLNSRLISPFWKTKITPGTSFIMWTSCLLIIAAFWALKLYCNFLYVTSAKRTSWCKG